MSESDQLTPDPELISALREQLAAGTDAKERVASRLSRSIGALTSDRALDPLPPRPGPRSISKKRVLSAIPFGLAATFSLGAAFGAALYAIARPLPVKEVKYLTVPAAPSSAPHFAPTATEPARPPPRAAPAHTVSSLGAAPGASAEHGLAASLAEQQALLDVARSAFARGDYVATLEALNTHFRRFPKSLLGEEREALEIKTLAASGRTRDVKARAARFRAQFPESVLLPSVNDSVQAIP